MASQFLHKAETVMIRRGPLGVDTLAQQQKTLPEPVGYRSERTLEGPDSSFR